MARSDAFYSRPVGQVDAISLQYEHTLTILYVSLERRLYFLA